MTAASQWFNDNKLAIMLISGVDCPDLVFANPGPQDIMTTNANKKHMLNYYSIAFTAYAKYCQVLKREMDRKFRPGQHPILFPLAPGQTDNTKYATVMVVEDGDADPDYEPGEEA